MDRLIDGLLLFSRMSQVGLQPEPVDLNQILERSLAQLQPDIEGRAIVWKKAPLPVVRADASMIELVFMNLLSNAIKYTAPRDPAEIEITSAPGSSNEVVICVRDNGVGFDMRYADKLFGVFQRLHASSEFAGTGIGLANVRRVIERHRGRTWAEGKPNAGATFYFSLPIEGAGQAG